MNKNINQLNLRKTKEDYQRIQIEKIIVSSNLSGAPLREIQRSKQHLEQLLKGLLPSLSKRSFTYTKIKKPNALWKTRRKSPAGLKVTIRDKTEILNLVQFLQKFEFNSFAAVNSKTLAYGIKEHRFLRLQKFSYATPEYGLSFFIVFKRSGHRLCVRKFNRQDLIYDFRKQDCIETLNKLISKSTK